MKLSFEMILRRNLSKPSNRNQEAILDEIKRLTHVRLDREDITTIDNLELLGPITNLYLQQNKIEKMENLECLSSSLKFLTLAGNNITCVDGLLMLKVLSFLDVSDNLIEQLDYKQLPKTIIFISFINNTCTLLSNYRESLKKQLPCLKSIDGELLDSESDGESEDSGEESEEEEEVQESSVQSLSHNLLLRSTTRLDDIVEEHRKRLKEIHEPQMKGESNQKKVEEKKTQLFADIDARIQDAMKKIIQSERDVENDFEL